MLKTISKVILNSLFLFLSSNALSQVTNLTLTHRVDSLIKSNPYLSESPKVVVVIENDTIDFETFKKLDLKKYDIVSFRLFQKKKSIRRFGDKGQDCVLLVKTRKNKKLTNH